MKKHDENKDLRSLAQVCKINFGDKTIKCSDKSSIGIHRWGKIDFLTKYCGWHFIFDKSAGTSKGDKTLNDSTSARDLKKAKKEHQLKDKRK